MKIVVGLGNPGTLYDVTRHNFGFMFLDYMAKKYKFKIEKYKCSSVIGETIINNEKIVFVKPDSFMNLSGLPVNAIKNWYKVDDTDIIVVFDDIDIPFGEIKYRMNGSGGSHNGMKSIVEVLKSENMHRIKLGLGNLKHPKQSLSDFVLFRFTDAQQKMLPSIFEKAEIKLLELIDK